MTDLLTGTILVGGGILFSTVAEVMAHVIMKPSKNGKNGHCSEHDSLFADVKWLKEVHNEESRVKAIVEAMKRIKEEE